MEDTKLETFDKTVQPYLKEIAERLWSNHAAVMVGSGFSKNATKNDYTKPDFPNWGQLGDILYQKLHGNSPVHEQYLNVLKLADEVEAAFGRPVLDHLLRDCIPDKDHAPSDLHVKLLELPWSDILTTNYDTLLERAAEQVYHQKYDVVINKKDLIYAEKPRIIKLHGSFSAERPLIVTEEDYRTYPKEFAPFVNTVQQSLLENTLCLLGFSGDDPNFLQWVGWIQDNLGRQNSPKIYLIGVLNLSDAQRKLLESKQIILVDLSGSSAGDQHGKALCHFLDFLKSEKSKDRYIEWPEETKYFSIYDENKDLAEVVSTWKKTRQQYPNWLILPRNQRNDLWGHTSNMLLEPADLIGMTSPLDIQFIYELNWRLEKCLQPVYNDHADAYENILKRYDLAVTDHLTFAEHIEGISYSELRQQWLELKFALLRFYREEGMHKKWDTLEAALKDLQPVLPAEFVARYHYEKCLYALFKLNLTQVSFEISQWPVNENLPFWEAKRASLMAELGKVNEAVKILEKSLTYIRKRLNLSPVISDYTWVSQEAYVMQLLQYVKNSLRMQMRQYGQNKEQSSFTERWNALMVYKCDPWHELEMFDTLLGQPISQKQDSSTSYNFDIGSKSNHYQLGGSGKEIQIAYQFLRYLEKSGISPRLPRMTFGKKALEGALKRLTAHSPYWSLSMMLRFGSKDLVKESLDRELIQFISFANIDQFLDHYLEVTTHMIEEFNSNEILQASDLSAIAPEIFSRFVVKCTEEKKTILLNLTLKIYQHPQRRYFTGVKNLLRRLLGSVPDRFIYEHLTTLLKFPVFDSDLRADDEFPQPFSLFSLSGNAGANAKIKIDKEIISDLLRSAKADTLTRKPAIQILSQLSLLGLMNAQQIRSFGQVLWSKTGSNGFPSGTNFFLYSFINLPHPLNIDPEVLYKHYLLQQKFPIHKKNKENGLSLTRGHISLFSELVMGTRTLHSQYGVTWDAEQSRCLLDKIIEWWDADKEFLLQIEPPSAFGSVSDEFRSRFSHLVNILSQVISINDFWRTDLKAQQIIVRLVSELAGYGFATINTRLSFLELFPEFHAGLFFELENTLAGEQDEEVIETCNTIIDMVVNPMIGKRYKAEFVHILDIVVYQIKWRNPKTLNSCINVAEFILRKHPGLFNKSHLEALCFGLRCLALDKEELIVDEKLVRRKKAAKLAYILYRYYLENNLVVPESILAWKEVCETDEEFGEIRKQWITI